MESVEYKRVGASPLTAAVFQVICYFDIFSYPLSQEEIRKYCFEKINKNTLKDILDELVLLKKIQNVNGFYFLAGKNSDIIQQRECQEEYLAAQIKKIKRYARLVSRFPFVETVFISGSVSKGVLNKEGDVDYFIVAKSRRVWLCRTLLILYKKIFLLGSKKYFCVNYFVDKQNLEVPDKNLFVATEIKTLVPVFDSPVTEEFYSANGWASEMFPNYQGKKEALFNKGSFGWFKRLVEFSCKGWLGEALDNFFFRKTINHWRKKFPQFNKDQFDLNMRSYKSVSKHHPQGNQARVLNELALRMNKL